MMNSKSSKVEASDMTMVQPQSRKKLNVRRMTVIAVLSSISIMLSMVPGIGYIPIGPTNATIMHIPVIIGAIVEGPVVGMAVGFIFGLTSMLRALTMPTITSFAFINPLVSIIPRVLIGIVAYYVYQLVVKLTKSVCLSGWLSGLIGSLVNTIGVLGMIYILYGERYAKALGESASAAKTLILTIATTNGIPEAVVGGFLVSAVAVVLKKRKK